METFEHKFRIYDNLVDIKIELDHFDKVKSELKEFDGGNMNLIGYNDGIRTCISKFDIFFNKKLIAFPTKYKYFYFVDRLVYSGYLEDRNPKNGNFNILLPMVGKSFLIQIKTGRSKHINLPTWIVTESGVNNVFYSQLP